MSAKTYQLAVGDLVGRYRVTEILGHDGLGSEYCFAEDEALGRSVVVRLLTEGDQARLATLRREAQDIAKLSHTSIVSLHDFGSHQGHPYFVLGKIGGGRTIGQMIRDRDEVKTEVALRLMETMCSALAHSHAHSVFLQRVTPEDILVSGEGLPVLLDFCWRTLPLDVPMAMVAYMAPERLLEHEPACASDLWSLGACFYEVLVGERLFVGATTAEIVASICVEREVDLSKLRAVVPEEVADLFACCLRRDPSERFGSAEALQEALRQAIGRLELETADTHVVEAPRLGATLLLYGESGETEGPGNYHRYEIRCLLGSGTFGDVYRATDSASETDVALKILKKQWLGDPSAVTRFKREAAILARMSHPNVVRVRSFGRYETTFFIAMELLERRNLADELAERGALGPDEAAAILIPVLEGLEAAHAAGIVHRDLKPENIGMHDGRIVVLDFGMADVEGAARATATGTIVGSAPYMSPEQVRGVALDGASDIYSIGTILYEMLTGRLPHEADALYPLLLKIASGPGTPIGAYLRDASPEIVSVMGRLHDNNPASRPTAAHARELLGRL